MTDPPLNDEDRQALERLRRDVAEAKAAGRWETGTQLDDTDKFEGPIGADADGNVITYETPEEAQQAVRERRARQGSS